MGNHNHVCTVIDAYLEWLQITFHKCGQLPFVTDDVPVRIAIAAVSREVLQAADNIICFHLLDRQFGKLINLCIFGRKRSFIHIVAAFVRHVDHRRQIAVDVQGLQEPVLGSRIGCDAVVAMQAVNLSWRAEAVFPELFVIRSADNRAPFLIHADQHVLFGYVLKLLHAGLEFGLCRILEMVPEENVPAKLVGLLFRDRLFLRHGNDHQLCHLAVGAHAIDQFLRIGCDLRFCWRSGACRYRDKGCGGDHDADDAESQQSN